MELQQIRMAEISVFENCRQLFTGELHGYFPGQPDQVAFFVCPVFARQEFAQRLFNSLSVRLRVVGSIATFPSSPNMKIRQPVDHHPDRAIAVPSNDRRTDRVTDQRRLQQDRKSAIFLERGELRHGFVVWKPLTTQSWKLWTRSSWPTRHSTAAKGRFWSGSSKTRSWRRAFSGRKDKHCWPCAASSVSWPEPCW